MKAVLHQAKPKEIVSMLMAYTENDKMTDDLLVHFENVFKEKFEDVNAEDISKYYYCFTKLGFKGEGAFYKYLQKSLTKLIDTFEGPHLRCMFYKFDEVQSSRLNTGVRGRLVDRANELITQRKISAYDV